jgi:hypothetical protein
MPPVLNGPAAVRGDEERPIPRAEVQQAPAPADEEDRVADGRQGEEPPVHRRWTERLESLPATPQDLPPTAEGGQDEIVPILADDGGLGAHETGGDDLPGTLGAENPAIAQVLTLEARKRKHEEPAVLEPREGVGPADGDDRTRDREAPPCLR